MGLSFWHLLIIVVIVLLLFGPSRLPGLGKSLGEAIRGFKKGIGSDGEIDVTDTSRKEQIRESEAQSASQKQSESEKHKS